MVLVESFFTFHLGDVSMTREDAAIGDNRDFQDVLYDEVNTIALMFKPSISPSARRSFS